MAVFFLTLPTPAQENLRPLEGPGVEVKFLTPGGRDTWKIEVEDGETLIAAVDTTEFDPVLRLIGPDEVELLAVDDEGSKSRFARRLDRGGEYRIVVHGFEDRGGGNYRLEVQRFRADPLRIGDEVALQLGADGRAYRRFDAIEDEVLVPRAEGAAASTSLLDPTGRPIADWMSTFRIEHPGEHVLVIQGQPRTRVRLRVRRAERRFLVDGEEIAEELSPGALHLWQMQCSPLDFRTLEIVRRDGVVSRLVFTGDRGDANRILGQQGFDLRALPVSSKGNRQRYATLFGRKGPFELQVLSTSPHSRSYRMSRSDPTRALQAPGVAAGDLAVGGSDFYSFEAKPGQLLRVQLSSQAFDTYLRLHDARGLELQGNDDDGTDLNSALELLVREGGPLRLQVSAHGDGGGGQYELRLSELTIPTLAAGEVARGTAGASARQYWRFEGRAGQSVILSVRSSEFDPRVKVLGPDGVIVGEDDDGGVDRDSLLPLQLAASGGYTFWVDGRGSGEYELRLILLE